MLNKHDMSMAKELAQEIVVANRLKEKERFENAFKAIKSMFEAVKENVMEIWDSIKDNINESRERIEHQKELRKSWHVPIKVNMPEPPFIENHNLQFARNHL